MPFDALAETCEADNSVLNMNMPVLLVVALIGATVGGEMIFYFHFPLCCFFLLFSFSVLAAWELIDVTRLEASLNESWNNRLGAIISLFICEGYGSASLLSDSARPRWISPRMELSLDGTDFGFDLLVLTAFSLAERGPYRQEAWWLMTLPWKEPCPWPLRSPSQVLSFYHEVLLPSRTETLRTTA